ncbi:MAG: transcription termination/antitermination protein NusG [Patescibacteria group bacterium]|nr:transcription termination/antitermination protein NusG [Patescibacteria group bacterium]
MKKTEEGVKQKLEKHKAWYVLHTYSGYEENVAKNLRQRIESLDMQDKIFSVLVPTEKRIKIKNGKRKVIKERVFPGYVLVEMIVTDDSWYVVRNTPNVTGFTGAGTTPIPISDEEVRTIKRRMGVKDPKYEINLNKGDAVKIIDGPFKDFDGKIQSVDKDRGKIRVLANLFSRETPIELDFLQVNKL